MKYLSLFTGIGGFELGITKAYGDFDYRYKADWSPEDVQEFLSDTTGELLERTATCVGYSEIDKYASQIYQRHYPDHKNYGDITKINEQELPDFELLVGGFPCQSFSIAGKRRGFSDTRGTLFFDIARILQAKQPRLLLLENVKGLLSHDNGRTFATIVSTLDELGYDLQWQVLNSKDFGVPQNRERVLIVGHLRGTRRPEVFPFGAGDSDPVQGDTEGENSATLTSSYGDNGRGTHIKVREATKQGYAIAEEGDSINLSVPNSATRRGRVGKGIAQTLDTGMQQHTLAGAKVRRLTPAECERLQGFPDGWTEGVSDTQRYKTLGNAVTTNVIAAVIEKMI